MFSSEVLAEEGLFFLPIGDIVLKGKSVPVTLYNPVTENFYKSEFSTRYLTCYKELKKSNREVSVEKTNKIIDESHAGKSMIELSLDFPNQPLAKFHTQRIKKGLVNTLVVMEDK